MNTGEELVSSGFGLLTTPAYRLGKELERDGAPASRGAMARAKQNFAGIVIRISPHRMGLWKSKTAKAEKLGGISIQYHISWLTLMELSKGFNHAIP